MRKRDSLFVEALEEMKHQLDQIKAHHQPLVAPTPKKPKIDASEPSSQEEESPTETVYHQKDTRSLWARIWNK